MDISCLVFGFMCHHLYQFILTLERDWSIIMELVPVDRSPNTLIPVDRSPNTLISVDRSPNTLINTHVLWNTEKLLPRLYFFTAAKNAQIAHLM